MTLFLAFGVPVHVANAFDVNMSQADMTHRQGFYTVSDLVVGPIGLINPNYICVKEQKLYISSGSALSKERYEMLPNYEAILKPNGALDITIKHPENPANRQWQYLFEIYPCPEEELTKIDMINGFSDMSSLMDYLISEGYKW